MPEIMVQYGIARSGVPGATSLRKWAKLALQEQPAAVTLRIVAADESQRLNANFRKQGKPTNVLSFPMAEEDYLGDVVLCHTVIVTEAAYQGKSLKAHYAHLVIHGILHLLGYDHIQLEERKKMETLEIKLLKQLGFANPYV